MNMGIINGIVAAALAGVLLSLAKICFSEIDVLFYSIAVMGATHLLFLIILIARKKGRIILTSGKLYPELYLVGFFAAALNLMGNWGLKLSSPSNAAILLRGDLFFSLIIGYLLWKEKISRLEWFGMGTMLVGIGMVLQLSVQGIYFGSNGDILILSSAFLLAVNAEIIKHRLGDVENTVVALFNSGMCFFIYLIGAVFTGKMWPLPKASALVWSLIFVSSVLQFAQYLAYYRCLRQLSTWLVRVIFLITPIVAIVSSAWWLHETIKYGQIWGMFMVAIGIMLVYWVQSNKVSTN